MFALIMISVTLVLCTSNTSTSSSEERTSSGFTAVSLSVLLSILHRLGCAESADIESMPGFQRPAYCNRTLVRFALCVSQLRLKMETSKAAIKWVELHFDTGGACQVHIGNTLVEVFPRRIWYLVRY